MAKQLNGRVFRRQEEFAAHPLDFQEDVKELKVYLTAHATEVFGVHHANWLKTVRSVRAKSLLETIDAWQKSKEDGRSTSAVAPEQAEPDAAAPKEAATADGAGHEEAPPAAAKEATSNRPSPGKQLLEGLLLDGYITSNKEHEKLLLKDYELFIPVAPDVTELAGPTVWQLVDGAVFAGLVKRKAGLFAPLTHGKDVYAMVNNRVKTLTLFDSDVGRMPLVTFQSDTACVAFDKSHFVHGVKIWDEKTTELLNATSQVERERLVQELVTIGCEYHEPTTVDVDKISSIYELTDVDMEGKTVSFDVYRGKVILLVNVSSDCGLTETNYQQLVRLYEKYKEHGLVILAFPCNQFGAQEPGTHEEICKFVEQYYVEFPVFAKGDVNGPMTRPVFSYAKSKCPYGDGSYIRWNFTKFLVDRNGQVMKQFAPDEEPLSFESEIVTLLSQQPDKPMEDEVETMTTSGAAAQGEEATPLQEMVEEGKLAVAALVETGDTKEVKKKVERIKAIVAAPVTTEESNQPEEDVKEAPATMEVTLGAVTDMVMETKVAAVSALNQVASKLSTMNEPMEKDEPQPEIQAEDEVTKADLPSQPEDQQMKSGQASSPNMKLEGGVATSGAS